MFLNGWPIEYADVVDYSINLESAAKACWKSCPDAEKRRILSSSLRQIAIGLNQLAYDIRKVDDPDETKKSLS